MRYFIVRYSYVSENRVNYGQMTLHTETAEDARTLAIKILASHLSGKELSTVKFVSTKETRE